ncbi:MAG TPA: glycosyltransferase [Acidocella sp.]|nr:glycosyltransferase [Acidocella sp.]
MRYGALGASSRLRIAQYVPYLQRAGLQTTLRGFLSDTYLKALYSGKSRVIASAAAYLRAFGAASAARRHDILWIEKEYLPWIPYWLERRAIGSTPYILDFDDAWSQRYEQSRYLLVRLMLGNKFRNLLRGATLTITANENLYKWAQSQGANPVLMLPTVVDLDHYTPCPAPSGIFTIGWIGTPLTAAYLSLIAEPLRRLAAEAPLKLLIIGAPDANIQGVTCENMPWSAATESALIGQCHVGIMPLPDDDWANGKSGYKLIQYMAMQRPAVASPIGANNQIIVHGQTGYLAQTPEDWLIYLRALRDNQALAEAFGAAARARVEQNYCLKVTAPILINKIRTIMSNTGGHRA